MIRGIEKTFYKRNAIFVGVVVTVALLIYNASNINFLLLKYRVAHQQKFVDCMKSAQPINSHGVFGICEDVDLGGVASATLVRIIVYDTTGVLMEPCMQTKVWNAVLEKMYILNQAPYTVKRIQENYYLLLFNFGDQDFTLKRCEDL